MSAPALKNDPLAPAPGHDLHIVLVEPEIPPNTGNIARLCQATGTSLHLIEPLGFSIEDRALRRAGMDYWQECNVSVWKSFPDWLETNSHRRLHLFTTKAGTGLWRCNFRPGDALIFGRETKGLPESLLAEYPDRLVRIPMIPQARSLNLSSACAIGLFEALRQASQDTSV